MHKIIFSPESLKKILGFSSKFRYGRVTLNSKYRYFFSWPNHANGLSKVQNKHNKIHLHVAN